MTNKNTCYNCAYRTNIPGDTHSECKFKWMNSENKPPLANQHGINSGWYMFPFNFDPIWQEEECKSFSETKDPNMFRIGSEVENLIDFIIKNR